MIGNHIVVLTSDAALQVHALRRSALIMDESWHMRACSCVGMLQAPAKKKTPAKKAAAPKPKKAAAPKPKKTTATKKKVSASAAKTAHVQPAHSIFNALQHEHFGDSLRSSQALLPGCSDCIVQMIVCKLLPASILCTLLAILLIEGVCKRSCMQTSPQSLYWSDVCCRLPQRRPRLHLPRPKTLAWHATDTAELLDRGAMPLAYSRCAATPQQGIDLTCS